MRLRMACLLLVASTVACTGSQTTERCQEACKRDAECYEEQDEEERTTKFDRDECEATCAVLERDSRGKELVSAHIECLSAATRCEQVRACQ